MLNEIIFAMFYDGNNCNFKRKKAKQKKKCAAMSICTILSSRSSCLGPLRAQKRTERNEIFELFSGASRDAIRSLKEFITTLICLYLHSYFIMLRDCGRNETIYIYKKEKCCECLLHQSSAASFFKLKCFLSSPLKNIARKFLLVVVAFAADTR
jgi:hypothetical protein